MQENQRPPKLISKNLFGTFAVCVLLAALVGALYFPVFTGDRRSTKSWCISNVKMVLTGTGMYMSDNDDGFPNHFSFDGAASHRGYVEAIYPYTKIRDILLCPQEQHLLKSGTNSDGQEGIRGVIDYVHCLSFRGVIPHFSEGNRFVVTQDIEDPKLVPYLRDPIRGYGTSKESDTAGFLSPHGGVFNIGYADFHVRSVPSPSLSKDL